LVSRKFSWKSQQENYFASNLSVLKRSLEVASEKSEHGRSVNQRVTIREVAAKAEVALSSVSRALSGHPDVSDEMRKRVKEVADELGYEPNLVAQSLRSGVTRTIGFVVRDINNPMFALLARSCEQELRRNGYSMILVNSDRNIENENRNFSLLRRRRVDGIIASLVSEDSPYIKKNLAGPRCPIVLLDREVKGVNASAVLADHAAGVHEAVTHLLNAGHREIAFVTGSNNVYPTRNRLQGFTKAFEDAGLKVQPDLLAIGGFDADYALSHARILLHRNPAPTAILAGGHGALMGISRALKEKNLTMGKEIAFIALDQLPYLEVFSDNISAVYRDTEAIGREAAILILEGIEGEKPRVSVIETEFIERASSQGGL
jgi:LacI family transcriptional regulator